MLIWCSVLITVLIRRCCLARCTPCSHLFRFWVYVFVQNLESFPGGGLPSAWVWGKFEISEYFPERELLPSSLTSLEIWNNPLSKSLNGDQLYLHWGLAAAQLFIPCQKRVCQHLYVSWVSRNVQLFIAEKSVPKGERERLVQDSSRTSYQNWWIA